MTLAGRTIAVVLMIAGVGLFGTFAAFVASLFITPEQRQVETQEDRILAELHEIRQRLDKLDKPGCRGPEC